MINNLIIINKSNAPIIVYTDYLYLKEKYNIFLVDKNKFTVPVITNHIFKKYDSYVSIEYILSENNLLDYKTVAISNSKDICIEAKNNNIDFYTFIEYKNNIYSKTYINSLKHSFLFDYGVGEISHSNENKTFYNISLNNPLKFEYLLFFDSRGLTNNEDNNDTFMYKLIQELKQKGKTYIAICRPKNIMIFATLINFLESNNLKFNTLISNLGFVDYTPKKKSLISDMKKQIFMSYKNKVKSIFLEDYILANSKKENLQTLVYDNEYIRYIQNILIKNFHKVFLITTPIIINTISIERKRPKSFFTQLYNTNDLIENIQKTTSDIIEKIDITTLFDSEQKIYTYDAVHYTNKGHSKIYKILINKGIINNEIYK